MRIRFWSWCYRFGMNRSHEVTENPNLQERSAMRNRRIEYQCEEGYTIRFATLEDIDKIMLFIREHWKETHILAHDRSFFEYEFVHGQEVAFVLLVNEKTDEIEGTLGYIPYQEEGLRDMFTVVWKVLNSTDLFRGVALLNYLVDNGRCRNLYSSGINPSTRSIYKYMGYQVAYLQQYYRLAKRNTYKIAKIECPRIPSVEKNREYHLREVHDFAEMKEYKDLWMPKADPYKDAAYIEKRYFRHPIYHYRIFSIQREQNPPETFVFMREIDINGTKVLRIVDVLGEKTQLRYLGADIDALLEEGQYEYIDFYQYGIDEAIMNEAGFVLRKKKDGNVIPNYFEPFLQENVEIGIFFQKELQPCIFKADGDQDRPSEWCGE